ncbi:MAG TPA: tetratricopeptide repeat protein, partial [Actinomycetes bacterium]|nr:tetratricopeptide repeat protein [Actinomycetes bacterium]
MDEIAVLVNAVLSAATPAAWRDAVQSFGPRLMHDPSLADAVLARADALKRQGRSSDGQTLRRWHDEVQRRIAEQRVMNALLQADSDAQVDALLRENPSVATPGNVEQGLGEVRQMIGRNSPYPPHIAAAVAGPILNVNLRIATFIGRADLRAQCLTERAMLATGTGDPAAALRDLEAAGSLWRSVGNLREAGRCLSMSGNALLDLGRRDDALERMLEAARLLEECGDDAILGPTYEDVAQILVVRGDLDGALRYLELTVRHRLAAGQVQKALPLLRTVVAMWLQRGDTVRALPHAKRLIDVCTEHRGLLEPSETAELVEMIRGVAVSTAVDSHSEVEFLRGLGDAAAAARYRGLIDPEKLAAARQWYAVAERAQPLAPSDEGAAVLSYVDALLCLSVGQHDRAVSQAEAALRFFDGRGDHDESLGVVSLLIQAEDARGRLASALAWCDEALARLNASGGDQRRSRATFLIHRGECLLALGRPQPALDDLNKALRLSRDDADPLARTNEGAAQNSLGRIYEFLGDIRAALEANREALRLARLLGHRRGEVAQLLALGTLIGKLVTGWLQTSLSPADADSLWQVALQADPSLAGLPPERGGEAVAVALLERAARLSEEIHDDAGWTTATLNLCNLLPASEDRRKVALLTNVVARKEAIGDRLGKAVALANLGAAHRVLGQDEDAARALEDSLAISQPAGYFESAAQAARDLADLRQRQGDLDAAEGGYREAVQMIEAARTQVPLDDRARVGFVRNKGRAYTSLVDLLVDREAHDEAFELVQRAKSRALLELAGTAGLQPTLAPRGRAVDLLAEE